MRLTLVGALVAMWVVPAVVEAKEVVPPHDRNDPDGQTACYFCHSLAVAGANGSNFNPGCINCHNQGSAFGAPWLGTDEAVPGVTGNSHNWSKPGLSPEHGAVVDSTVFADEYKWIDGKLQCVVCHNPHQTPSGLKPKTKHTSIPEGVGQGPTSGTGTGQLTLTTLEGAGAEGFRLKIQTLLPGGGTFIISHNYAWKADSWLNWNGTAWVAGTANGVGRQFDEGVDVDLDIPGVKVRWSAGAAVGDYWDFYVGYPFLRITDQGDAICVSCHKERAMNHIRARGDDRYYRPNGIRKFSHPVGVGLNANGFGTDRTRVLDVDGTATTDVEGKVGTSTSDAEDGQGNATNDLVMEGGVVRCTTCHRVHNADTNSYTRDAR
jgi:hypothetical protein